MIEDLTNCLHQPSTSPWSNQPDAVIQPYHGVSGATLDAQMGLNEDNPSDNEDILGSSKEDPIITKVFSSDNPRNPEDTDPGVLKWKGPKKTCKTTHPTEIKEHLDDLINADTLPGNDPQQGCHQKVVNVLYCNHMGVFLHNKVTLF